MRYLEYEEVYDRPFWLNKTEKENPALVIKDFFCSYDIHQCRFYLWHLLQDAMQGNKDGFDTDFTASDMLAFFENTICLIEAAKLINDPQKEEAFSFGQLATPPATHLNQLQQGEDEADNPLAPVIYTISQSMDAEKIFLLGTYEANPVVLGTEYDLMVLINSTDKRPLHEYESLIVNRCHDFVPITVTVHELSKINSQLAGGNIFFSQACSSENLIYDAGRTALAEAADVDREALKAQAEQQFTSRQETAKEFLKGAKHYLQNGNYQLAAFMLHQAVEHSLSALLTSIMDYRIRTHNLNKLLFQARRIAAPGIMQVFPRDTDEEIRLFSLLQKAYIHARYKDCFPIKKADVQLLLERVALLQERVVEGFDGFIRSSVKISCHV